jgi:RNA polymerase sigma factor (sigma-70 family)
VPGPRDAAPAVEAADPAVEDLLRDLAPRVLAVLTRRSGDFDAAEDAVQEALLTAADHWTRDGVPAAPYGWLLTTAQRRLIDQRRSERSRMDRELVAGAFDPAGDDASVIAHDDTLVLLFLCCHPSLTPASAVALTLRAIGGLSTAEVARAFVVPESTMAQRISRAKQTIRASGLPFRLPTPDERPESLRSVLRVLYLMFNEGYAASEGGSLIRPTLVDEAVRLARVVHQALPDDAEVAGLLALMLLTDARRAARVDPGGRPVPLADQDRTRWDRAAIAEGTSILDAAIAHGSVGEYQLLAAVAAIHDRAPTAEATDWSQVAALYELLERMTGNPVVTLNRAVAVAMADGPSAGLALLDTVDDRFAGTQRMEAVRAHLLERAGDRDSAAVHYRAAARLATSVPERDYLATQAARLGVRTTG